MLNLFIVSLLLAVTAAYSNIDSSYTPKLDELARNWQQQTLAEIAIAAPDANGLAMRALATKDNEFYIGSAQSMLVGAPLDAVAKTLESFEKYTEWFDGAIKSEVKSREGDKLVLFTEQHIPIPLIANARTEMAYQFDRSQPGVLKIRYQLKESNKLKNYDGLIVLEASGDSQTRFTEFDFFDAHWGIATTLAPEKIWRDSMKGVYQANLAIKLRVEHSDWSDEQVFEASVKAADAVDFAALLKEKKSL